MAIRKAEAVWEGNFRDGAGTVSLGSGAFEGSYSAASRFEDGAGTNPEELIGAAHAGCFSMALSLGLQRAGYDATRIQTVAKVHLDKVDNTFKITTIELETEATVPGIDEATFMEQAQGAKNNCPVSQVLAAAEITLQAKLIN
ncbi:MAG: OsmC family protein [Anaerolineae bacterium]|nr:OsmC family protein [Anaerolineae bacterium]MCB9102713.1 OsmC family protein [Anaerolineales bacterium]